MILKLSRRRLVSFAAAVLFAPGSLRAGESDQSSLAQWQARLNAHVSDERFAGAVLGLKVVSLDTGKTLFEHDAHKLLSPASNTKLYTVALALDTLGQDYRFPTSLYATAPPRGSRLKGDLIVYGRGDPTFNARLNGGDILRALQPLVRVVTNAGIRRIQGDLVADESFLRGPPYGSGWGWDDLEFYYGAEISALSINDNALQLVAKPGPPGKPCSITLVPQPPAGWMTISNSTVTREPGSKRTINSFRPLGGNVFYVSGDLAADDRNYTEEVTFQNPASLFGAWFREALLRAGVKVSGKVRVVNSFDRDRRPLPIERLTHLGNVVSPPLSELAREINKPSQNLYTDLLLGHVGEQLRADDPGAKGTSEELGIRALEAFLTRANLPAGEVHFEEGSGLSRNNLTTAAATVALLQYMSRHSASNAFMESLPIAGVDGTLRNRLKDTPAAGNLRAKTGTLRWANSLSGYVQSAAGERLAFGLMLNRYHGHEAGRSGRAEVDALAVLLASLSEKSPP